MAGNAQKTPVSRSINKAAEKQAWDALQLTGKGLPCSVVSVIGSIVVVKFELANIPFTIPNTMMAIAGSEYIRIPVQAGMKGICLPASARIGNMNGLGVGTPDLSVPGNLAALTFFPIGNKGWEAIRSI